MKKSEIAQQEIRAIFSNEIDCLSETTRKLGSFVIFSREIVLAGMNSAEGLVCRSHCVYAIHKDGYWEQIAADSQPFKSSI